MTPLLILLFGIHPSTTVGSDLLYAATTKTVGTSVHGFRGCVDWCVVGRLATGSAPMTVIIILLCSLFGVTHENSRFLNDALGVVLVITACSVIFQARITRIFSSTLGRIGERQRILLTVLIGAVLGVVVTLTSVGAGAIGVTALIMLYPKLPPARIVGSDIAHAVPLTLLAGAGHWRLGDVNLDLVGALLLGSIPGVINMPSPRSRSMLWSIARSIFCSRIMRSRPEPGAMPSSRCRLRIRDSSCGSRFSSPARDFMRASTLPRASSCSRVVPVKCELCQPQPLIQGAALIA